MFRLNKIVGGGMSCLLLLFLLPVITVAQDHARKIYDHVQSWMSMNSVTRFSDKFGIVADAHVRRTNFIADPNFYFLRIGANFWLQENLTTTIGYGHMWVAPSRQDWHLFAQENRIYQQVQLSTKVHSIKMVQRIRNEQRWQEKIVNDRFANHYKFTNRVRYLLSFTIPVAKNPRYPSLVVADELMIQFGKEIIYNPFDQNRIFIGVKQPMGRQLSFDFGYMLVHQQRASGYQYDNNHTLRLFFYYNPDLRKK